MRQTEKTVKDSTNFVLEMDHGETFPAIYLGQDVDVCFCEENNVTEIVVSHCEGGKLRMAMDEFQSQVNKREMLISCYALSDFSSSALDEDYEPSAYLARLIKSTFPWLKTAKKEPKRTARSKLAADNADYMRKFQFMGGDLDSEQGILQTGLVIETVRGHTPGTKSHVGLYDGSDLGKHGNYCESSILWQEDNCQCSMYQHLDEFYHGVLPNEGRDAYWKGLSHNVKCIHLDTSTDHLYDPTNLLFRSSLTQETPKWKGNPY